jgi:hypothetical protein
MHLRLASHRESLAWREGESESDGRQQLVMGLFSCLDSMHLLLGVLAAQPASPFSDTSSTELAWRIPPPARRWLALRRPCPHSGTEALNSSAGSAPRPSIHHRPALLFLAQRQGEGAAISFCLYACNVFVLMPNKNYYALTLAACVEEQKVTGKH